MIAAGTGLGGQVDEEIFLVHCRAIVPKPPGMPPFWQAYRCPPAR